MVEHMEKRKIIELKEEGLSNREVARQTGFDRDTVSKYWNEYRRRLQELGEPGVDKRAIQDSLFAAPRRAAATRTRHKYTETVDTRLNEILKEEEKKTRLLGSTHKQKLTNRQIHTKLVSEGFDVSEGTINMALANLRKRQREVFIRQRYDLGDRLEYDFGRSAANHRLHTENLSYGGIIITGWRFSVAVSVQKPEKDRFHGQSRPIL